MSKRKMTYKMPIKRQQADTPKSKTEQIDQHFKAKALSKILYTQEPEEKNNQIEAVFIEQQDLVTNSKIDLAEINGIGNFDSGQHRGSTRALQYHYYRFC